MAEIYKQTPSGTIYKESYYYYYVPRNCPKNSNASVFYPGAGSDDGTTSFVERYIYNNNPNEVIIFSQDCDSSLESTQQIINNISNNFGINVRNDVNYYGFSAGANTALKNAALDIQRNPNAGKKTIVLLESAYQGSNLACDGQTISALKKNNASIFMFEGPGYSGTASAYDQPHVLALAKAGIPVVIAENSRWDNDVAHSHTGVCEQTIRNRIVDYINGDIEYLNDIGNYRFKVFDKTTNSWKMISKDEVRSYLGTGEVTADFSSLKNIGLFDTDSVMEKYKIKDSLKSDVEFVVEYANKIRSCVKETTFLTGIKNPQYTSTTKIPSQESTILNQYYKTAGTLLSYIVQESEAIIGVAGSIDELDSKLASGTTNLNDILNEIAGVNSFDVNNTLGYQNDASNGGTGGNLLAALAVPGMVAADAIGSKSDPYLEETNETDDLYTEPSSEEEFLDFDDLAVDPNVSVIDCGSYNAVYHYDENGKVNNVEYYYDFDSESAALDNIDDICEKFANMNGVNYVTSKGKQIKVVFKEDYSNNFTSPNGLINSLRGDVN